MKLHFFTQNKAPYSYDSIVDIIDDKDFFALTLDKSIQEVLNTDEIIDILCDNDFSGLIDVIVPLFDMSTDGEFDWEEKTGEYYQLFNQMLNLLNCQLISDSGDILNTYSCELSDGYSFNDAVLSLYLPNFYCGNGEPEGAQLALNIVDNFMRSGQWNIGFYDSDGLLIVDIAEWAKIHQLDIHSIRPIVWFGKDNIISDCWSITPDTTDLFIRTFWDDYYEGALPYICDAESGLGIYYSVWEYGLDYNPSLFEDIKLSCPLNLNLTNEDRVNALFNLVISLYNDNKDGHFHIVEEDSYAHDVINCDICVVSNVLNYSYSKPYKFVSQKIAWLDSDNIEEILLEDTAYKESFIYLKDIIIGKCDLSSYKEVWETINMSICSVQEQLNKEMKCQILKSGEVIRSIPFSVDLNSHYYIPRPEIHTIVFMKALNAFFKRGRWYMGYKDASELPTICDAMAKKIPQSGKYPVLWFNDSEEIIGKMGIWPACQQYMLSLTWKSISDFCSNVCHNIDVHNNFQGTPIYNELKIEFERVKSECPIHIYDCDNPVDFNELEQVVRNSCCADK